MKAKHWPPSPIFLSDYGEKVSYMLAKRKPCVLQMRLQKKNFIIFHLNHNKQRDMSYEDLQKYHDCEYTNFKQFNDVGYSLRCIQIAKDKKNGWKS